MCQMWQSDTEICSLEMEDASLFISGCIRLQVTEHINNVNFSLFIKESRVLYSVCSEDSARVWIFWHWSLIFPSGDVFLE